MLENSMEKLSLLHCVLKAFLLVKNRQYFETTLLYASLRDFNCNFNFNLYQFDQDHCI